MVHQLLGQGPILFSTSSLGRVKRDRPAEGRALPQLGVNLDNRVEEHAFQAPLHLVEYDLADLVAPVIHRHQYLVGQPGIRLLSHLLNQLHEVTQRVRRVVITLDRDNQQVSRRQSVKRERSKGWRTVDLTSEVFPSSASSTA